MRGWIVPFLQAHEALIMAITCASFMPQLRQECHFNKAENNQWLKNIQCLWRNGVKKLDEAVVSPFSTAAEKSLKEDCSSNPCHGIIGQEQCLTSAVPREGGALSCRILEDCRKLCSSLAQRQSHVGLHRRHKDEQSGWTPNSSSTHTAMCTVCLCLVFCPPYNPTKWTHTLPHTDQRSAPSSKFFKSQLSYVCVW